MSELMTQLGLEHLTAQERLQLVGELWESLATEPEAVALTPEQQADLSQRLASHQDDPQSGTDWDIAKARLREISQPSRTTCA